MTPALAFAFLLASIVASVLWKRQVALRRDAYIRTFVLPHGLFEKLCKRHPHLTLKECQLISQGLRQFFLAYRQSGYQYISMPSQVADDLWHEFILHTKNYQSFCQKAFGRFLHHTPAVVLSGTRQSNTGLRRCWRLVCQDENINPHSPSRLPLLFALDVKLNIPDGFRYALDCAAARSGRTNDHGTSVIHCGGDFSSSSFDGGTSGLDDGGGSGDGGSDGSGCGGGCGGGD